MTWHFIALYIFQITWNILFFFVCVVLHPIKPEVTNIKVVSDNINQWIRTNERDNKVLCLSNPPSQRVAAYLKETASSQSQIIVALGE